MDRVIGRIEPAYSILKCWTQLLSWLMIAHGYIVPTVALGEPYLYAWGDGIRVLQPYCNRVRMGVKSCVFCSFPQEELTSLHCSIEATSSAWRFWERWSSSS